MWNQEAGFERELKDIEMSTDQMVQLALAGATFQLAVAAFLTILFSYWQHGDQKRASVVPVQFPFDSSNWLVARNATVGPQRPVALKNIGSGRALWLQWEVASVPLPPASKMKAILSRAKRRIARLLRAPIWESPL